MKLLKNFWVSVRRNPVINAFLIAVALQVFQDWRMGNIDFAHILGYLATTFIAVATRYFTVPEKEHFQEVVNLHAEIQKRGRW